MLDCGERIGKGGGVAADAPPEPAGNGARMVGRPRRLTLDQLLDAAIEAGLNDLNMKELAARLGVGIATLYRYVENRETLIRLATGRQASRQVPPDTGQDWAVLTRAYATTLFSSLGQNPHLLIGFVEGQWGVAVELEFVDAFLGAMTARGFTSDEALHLYRMMGQVVVGAAAAAGHFAALSARGEDQRRELSRALAEWEPDELPHLRAVADRYIDERAACDFLPALEAMLRDFGRDRLAAT